MGIPRKPFIPGTTEDLERLTVALPSDLLRQLRAESGRSNETLMAIVRRALQAEVRRLQEPSRARSSGHDTELGS